MFKEEREGIPDWLSEWMNELSDIWIKWRIRGFFAQPLRFLRYWRTSSSNRKKSLSVRDWKSSKEHPKSSKGHLKNGPVSNYLITYKSSCLGILPSLYFFTYLMILRDSRKLGSHLQWHSCLVWSAVVEQRLGWWRFRWWSPKNCYISVNDWQTQSFSADENLPRISSKEKPTTHRQLHFLLIFKKENKLASIANVVFLEFRLAREVK